MKFIFFLIILVEVCSETNIIGLPPQTSRRDPRTLIFEIPNTSCTPRFGDLLLEGFCDTFASCIVNGGTKVGFCPGSTNICCLISAACGSVVATRTAYFFNPGHPAGAAGATNCTIRIRRFTNKHDQIRLDITELNIDPPDAMGNCTNGYFQVTGSDTQFKVPVICGSNANQHMYLNFGPVGVDLTLNIVTTGAVPATWMMTITQIETNSAEKVPEGCLQYFPGTRGSVRSFNFEGADIHLANQDYDVCLERTSPTCMYTWELTGASSVFDITDLTMPTEEECLADDYITILRTTTTTTPRPGEQIIHCGEDFVGVRTSYNRLQVFFNGQEPQAAAANDLGFSLNFVRTC